MRRGRPTDDPKPKLVAARLGPRHVRLIKERARKDRVTFSEALRRILDDVAVGMLAPRSRRSKPRA